MTEIPKELIQMIEEDDQVVTPEEYEGYDRAREFDVAGRTEDDF